MIGLVSPLAWNVYEVCPSDMYLQVGQFSPHGYEPRGWLCCVRLRSLALTRKSLRLSVFANNGLDGTKGSWVLGDNKGNTF